jgi:hypothetical protein
MLDLKFSSGLGLGRAGLGLGLGLVVCGLDYNTEAHTKCCQNVSYIYFYIDTAEKNNNFCYTIISYTKNNN